MKFKAEADGFYTLDVDVGSHSFTLLSANVPAAIDTTKKAASLIRCAGPLFVHLHEKTDLFTIGVAGENDSEAVCAVISDPDGQEVWRKDTITVMERFTTDKDQGLKSGLWQVRFARPGKGVFEDFRVDVLGTPGYLFLNPDRYWAFR